MAALSNSFITGWPMKMTEQTLLCSSPMRLSLCRRPSKKAKLATGGSRIVVRAGIRDTERPRSESIFVGGFVLGGIIVGTIGCIYAPKISEALAAADRKDLMRKLPKFIYDEEKALEKTRKVLAEKIEQLNAAIDDVSSQLRADDTPNGVAVASTDEVEAPM